MLLVGGALVAAAGCARSQSDEVARSSAPIIGGKLDTAHKGVVSLLKQVQGGYYPSCSGTLLTQNLVLTAHHCVAGLDSEDGSSVECGKTNFTAPDRASTMIVSVEANVGQEGIDPFRVAEVWLPPNAGSAVCGKDIALLLLAGSGVPASVATPIEPRVTSEVDANDVFAAIGYGLQDPNDQQGQTVGHRMIVTDAQVFCAGQDCGSPLVTSTEFIADSPVCSGDSGGPALDAEGRVSGVTSRGDPDCTVGIYSSVFAWRTFIKDATFDAATKGHYLPPAWAGPPPEGFDPGISQPGSGGSAGSGGSGNASGGASTGAGGSVAVGGSMSASGGALSVAGTGNTTPSVGGGSPSSPTIDPLGLACTGTCPGSYLCWAASGQPPGICVPACGEGLKACPERYTCSEELGACIISTAARQTPAVADSDGGCSVAAPAPRGTRLGLGAGTWLLALALGLAGRRSRARRRPSGT